MSSSGVSDKWWGHICNTASSFVKGCQQEQSKGENLKPRFRRCPLPPITLPLSNHRTIHFPDGLMGFFHKNDGSSSESLLQWTGNMASDLVQKKQQDKKSWDKVHKRWERNMRICVIITLLLFHNFICYRRTFISLLISVSVQWAECTWRIHTYINQMCELFLPLSVWKDNCIWTGEVTHFVHREKFSFSITWDF